MSSPIAEVLPGPIRRGCGVARVRLHEVGETSWWDAVDMRDGTRRLLRYGPPCADGIAWSPDPDDPVAFWSAPLTVTLGDLLPVVDEPTIEGDPVWVAAITVAALSAWRAGRVGDGVGLIDRTVALGTRWTVIGADAAGTGSEATASLLATVDAADTFGLGAVLQAGAPVGPERFLVARFAAYLAHERHVLAARAAAGRRTDALAALRALAHRLAYALAPPADPGPEARSDRSTVFSPDNAPIWNGHTLDPPRARAAARALIGRDPSPAIRRWLVAMSRLRVDRELLARR